MTVVGVYIIGVPFVADKRYDYILPSDLAPVARGRLVTVPFGRGDHRRTAVVIATEEREDTSRLKRVLAAECERFSLSEEMLSLALFLREHTLCAFGDAVRAILPPALLSGDATAKIAYENEYSAADPAGLGDLLAKTGHGAVRSPAHRRLLEALLDRPSLTQAEAGELGLSNAQLSAMMKNGWLTRTAREVLRSPYGAGDAHPDPIVLSRAQTEAYERLLTLSGKGEAAAALLFGVTGSGKTKVMMKLMDSVIAEGRGVILMVPEIALTPQTVGIFCHRYGSRVAVIHSSLSAGERFDAWRRIAGGEVDLVIGTRSAVFAPMPRLGLILIDEEHEHTYKSDADPKYHTRDVAAFRAARHRALVVMASATPSLESYYKAERGIYTLVPLTERFGGNPLPDAEVVDMRQELRHGNLSPISVPLAERIAEMAEAGEQAILFLNRRGYHAALHCRGCGYVFNCPNCSVALTHHTGDRGAYLMCHTCGHRTAVPHRCPECDGDQISYLGAGTQKAEGMLAATYPDLRVMRMDADTTSGKEAYDRMLEAFRAGEADILLGTQMVTKGHDFPRVTLSGVLAADISLNLPDFRAAERTFALLTQVIGRAGRGAVPGRAVIQTFSPDNEVIALACRQDYVGFYRREIELRRELTFPPFCHIAQFTLTGEEEESVTAAARDFCTLSATRAKERIPNEPMVIFGPFEARTFKAEGRFRMRLIVKCRLTREVRAHFGKLLCEYIPKNGVTLSVDLDPTDV